MDEGHREPSDGNGGKDTKKAKYAHNCGPQGGIPNEPAEVPEWRTPAPRCMEAKRHALCILVPKMPHWATYDT